MEILRPLIKTLNMQGGKIAPTCAQAISIIDQKLSCIDEVIYGDIFKEAVTDLHHAAGDLQSLRQVNKENGFITRDEMNTSLEWSNSVMLVSCIISAVLGGVIGALAVRYAQG